MLDALNNVPSKPVDDHRSHVAIVTLEIIMVHPLVYGDI